MRSLDKRRFLYVGLGLFSGVTTVLFPLSVIKTRQMAEHGVPPGLSGTAQVARLIWQRDGPRGFYRGFGTVLFGTIPSRTLYMTTLELAKSSAARLGSHLDASPAALAAVSSFVGGAAASLSTQVVIVPVDVVSQRLMVQGQPLGSMRTSSGSTSVGSSSSRNSAGAPQKQPSLGRGSAGLAVQAEAAALPSSGNGAVGAASAAGQQLQPRRRLGSSAVMSSAPHRQCAAALQQAGALSTMQPLRLLATTAAPGPANGLAMARLIVAQEGLGGLYRGFWPSVATFVPSNAIWWGSYGFWRQIIGGLVSNRNSSTQASSSSSSSSSGSRGGSGGDGSTAVLVGVQAVSGVLAGCTAALLTNPLDIVKTRLQVADPTVAAVPTWGATLRELLAEEGPKGLLRGAAPRMASSALWGTAMVTTYEFLKRICALPDT